MEADFPSSNLPLASPSGIAETDDISSEDQAVILWLVLFTCLFQTQHGLSSRAVEWLLKVLGGLLLFLGQYTVKIANIAQAFPSTSHLRAVYLEDKLQLPYMHRYVACRECLSLYDFENCFQKRGNQIRVKSCQSGSQGVSLLKKVITSTGNAKYYPFMVYPYTSLISSFKCLFSRSGFYNDCELWRKEFSENETIISDKYHGRIWKDFLNFQGSPFLTSKNSIAVMLKVDSFQPYKHLTYGSKERT